MAGITSETNLFDQTNEDQKNNVVMSGHFHWDKTLGFSTDIPLPDHVRNAIAEVLADPDDGGNELLEWWEEPVYIRGDGCEWGTTSEFADGKIDYCPQTGRFILWVDQLEFSQWARLPKLNVGELSVGNFDPEELEDEPFRRSLQTWRRFDQDPQQRERVIAALKQ